MPETQSNVTPNTPQPGSQSAPSSSSPTQNADSANSSDKTKLVADLVARGSEKFARKDAREAAKSAEGKARTAPTAAVRSESVDTKSSQKTNGSSSAEHANTSTGKQETTPQEKKANASGEATTVEGDPALAKRIAAIATAEQNARVATEKLKTERESFEKERTGHKALVDNVNKFAETFRSDPLAALKLLGLEDEHVNGLYWKLNDRYLNGKSQTLSPEDIDKRIEARAREIAEDQYKKLQENSQTESKKQFETAMEAARAQYITRTAEVFQANKAKFPAIAALGIPAGDVHKYVEDTYRETQKMPTFDETLTHFETQLSKKFEAAGYTRQQKIEAPTATEKPSPGKTVTADWQSRSTPSPTDDEKPKSLRESREEIKRKLDQGFFKRK